MSEIRDRIDLKDYAKPKDKMRRIERKGDRPSRIVVIMGIAILVLLADKYYRHSEATATDRAAYTCRVDVVDGVRIESCVRMVP